MSNSISSLLIPAAALKLLQTRGNAAMDALQSAVTSEQQVTQLLQQASESLAADASQGAGSAPRGTLLNILV